MSISNEFPRPKDPQDSAWYVIIFGEPLATLLNLTVTPTTPDDTSGLAYFQTPGDSYPAEPLVASFGQISQDTLGVDFKLDGGAPGTTYAVRAGVVTTGGSTLFRSIIIPVTGL